MAPGRRRPAPARPSWRPQASAERRPFPSSAGSAPLSGGVRPACGRREGQGAGCPPADGKAEVFALEGFRHGLGYRIHPGVLPCRPRALPFPPAVAGRAALPSGGSPPQALALASSSQRKEGGWNGPPSRSRRPAGGQGKLKALPASRHPRASGGGPKHSPGPSSRPASPSCLHGLQAPLCAFRRLATWSSAHA